MRRMWLLLLHHLLRHVLGRELHTGVHSVLHTCVRDRHGSVLVDELKCERYNLKYQIIHNSGRRLELL